MTYASPSAVAEIISLAGGRIVGRTKLQKSACALELVGLGYGFLFSYKHFGPYSEQLKIACGDAEALNLIQEKAEVANWGGWYSVFTSSHTEGELSQEQKCRQQILGITAEADSIQLELAITTAFLATHGTADPWKEIVSRKPTKATPDNLVGAKKLYQTLQAIPVPKALPSIAGALLMGLLAQMNPHAYDSKPPAPASHMLSTINM